MYLCAQHTKCQLVWQSIIVQPPGKYRDQNELLFCDAGVGRCICAPSTQNVSLSGRASSCSPLANTAIKMSFCSALPSSTGLASSATLQGCLLKLISALWTVLLVFISSALRMLLLPTWTKISFKHFFAFSMAPGDDH